MHTVNGSPPSLLRRRLWAASIGLAFIVGSLVVAETVRRTRQPGPLVLGHDLLPSYVAGRLVREGHADRLYDLEAFEREVRGVVTEADLAADPRFSLWLNPPFFAWLFAPLSLLSYRSAAAVWTAASLALFWIALIYLCGMFCPPECKRSRDRKGAEEAESVRPLRSLTVAAPLGADSSNARVDWRVWGLIPLLLVCSVPFWMALTHLQNTFLSLALLCGVVTLWRNGRAMPAGLLAGLMFYKPQLAAVVALVLALSTGWRALAGVALTGSVLLALNLLTLPGTIEAFLGAVPKAVHKLQTENNFNWVRQVTFTSLWRILLQGNGRGETWPIARVLGVGCSLAIATALAWAVRQYRKAPHHPVTRDRLISAAVLCMPLVMPYYMDYDLLLLAVPAVLLAAELTARPDRRTSHWMLGLWVAFFCATLAGITVAEYTRVHVTVACLVPLAAASLARCLRADGETVTMPREVAPPARAAA